MAHPSLVESLFSRKRSRNISIFSTTKDSEDINFVEEIKIKVRFTCKAKTMLGQEVRVIGNSKELGNWNVNESILLTTNTEKYPLWSSTIIALTVPLFPHKFEYKYIIKMQHRNEAT